MAIVTGAFPVLSRSYPAAAAYNAGTNGNYGYVMKVNSSGQAVLCSSVGEVCAGILQNKPALDGAAEIMEEGACPAVAGAAIAAGALCSVDATGRLITALATHYILGQAQNAASAAGDMVQFRILHAGLKP